MDKVTYMFLTLMAKIRSIVSDIADIRKSSAAGAPTKVTKASEMTDTDRNYLYLGTESGYNSGHIYYFVEGVLTDGGAYGGVNVDATLTQSGQAADAKVTGDEIAEIKEDLSHKTGLSEEVKQTLLACFANVAWIDEHGQDYYDALEDALYPPVDLVRITAVYTQSGMVYTTESLDSLKADLVVTAYYTDGSSSVVTTGYALSGVLAKGTSIITVSYGGKNATFTVQVTVGIKLYDSDFVRRRRNTSNAPNYYGTIGNRASYSNFDLMVSGGKTYRITFDASYDTAQVGAQFWNQVALDNVESGLNLSADDLFDPGWLASGAEFEVPIQQNGSDIKCVRFTSRQDTDNTILSDDFAINYMILEEI